MADLLYKPVKSRQDIDQLLAQHKNLVYYMLGSMGQLYNHDCESAAWEALWNAVELFDVYSKTAFSTYACRLMRNAINDALRKEATHQSHEVNMTDYTQGAEPTASELSVDNRVDALFAEYITGKQGTCRNVLLAWNASGFEAQGNELAKACGCTPSYVSRVQRDFRAYLQLKLREP